MSQGSYCFPVVDPKDIVQYMSSAILDMDVTLEDFRDPQKDRWHKLFTLLLCDCCLDLSPESLYEIPITANFSCPELFENSKALFNLFKCMQALLTTCGIDDFRMSDILEPKPKRLVRACSAIMNFRRFQEDRLKVSDELHRENDAVKIQRETLLAENEELLQKINHLKSVRAEKEPEIEMIQEQITNKEEFIEAKHAVATKITNETNELKTNVAERKSAVSRMKEQLVALKHEDTNISGQIVASPERLRGESQRMKHQLAQLKQANEEYQSRFRELNIRREIQQRRDQDCDQAKKQAEALKEQDDKKREVQLLLSNQKEEAVSIRDEMKNADARSVQLKLQLSILHEKMEKYALMYNGRIKEMKTTMELLQQDKAKVRDNHSQEEEASYLLQQELQVIKQEQKEEIRQHSESMAAMRDKYKQIQSELDSFHTRLGISCVKLKDVFED